MNDCTWCGFPTNAKKLRLSDDGSYNIFCRDCVRDGCQQ